MARGKYVTQGLVERVYELKRMCPEMTSREMERITGMSSRSTIAKILRGDYDHLLDDPCDDVEDDSNLDDISHMLVRIVGILEDNHKLLREIVDALE